MPRANGNLGPALALKDPLYQALVTEEGLRKVIAQGVPGTMMPVFARKSGGVLTDRQINILAHEMKARWGRPREFANVKVPPYSLQEAMAEGSDRGDPQRGARVYAKYCARCHGKDGTGGPKGGSIVDDSYLALVSDQALRTVAITGRRDLGKPDWRDNTPGPPMTTQEINDVVAWLVSHRQVFPGRPYAGR